jgi:hypothetical protein
MEGFGMFITRPQWPHTVADITKSLDGVWGLVGATGTNGNLLRLERSLKEPLIYTLTEYAGNEDKEVLRQETFSAEQKEMAVKQFAGALGFHVS